MAGLTVNLLTDEAYNQIIDYSNRTIRVINQIMDKALLILSAKKADIIDRIHKRFPYFKFNQASFIIKT